MAERTSGPSAAACAIWRRFPWADSTRVKTAIAVAPVTHWKFYDSIYTERYNGLPQDNAAGYDRGSPLTYAANLRGKRRDG